MKRLWAAMKRPRARRRVDPRACPACNATMERLAHITNIHITGDDRTVHLVRCPRCSTYYLSDFLDEMWAPGGEQLIWRVLGPVPPDKADEYKRLMESCPQPDDKYCWCDAHEHFDWLNIPYPIIRVLSQKQQKST